MAPQSQVSHSQLLIAVIHNNSFVDCLLIARTKLKGPIVLMEVLADVSGNFSMSIVDIFTVTKIPNLLLGLGFGFIVFPPSSGHRARRVCISTICTDDTNLLYNSVGSISAKMVMRSSSDYVAMKVDLHFDSAPGQT